MAEDQIDRYLRQAEGSGRIFRDSPDAPQTLGAVPFTRVVEAVNTLPHINLSLLKKGDLLKISFQTASGEVDQWGNFVVVEPGRRKIKAPGSFEDARLKYTGGNCLPRNLHEEILAIAGARIGTGNARAMDKIMPQFPIIMTRSQQGHPDAYFDTLPVADVEVKRGSGDHFQNLSQSDLESTYALEFQESEQLRVMREIFSKIEGLAARSTESSGELRSQDGKTELLFLVNKWEGRVGEAAIYSGRTRQVYSISRVNSNIVREEIFHLEVFTEVDRDKFLHAVSHYNPWDIAQGRFLYNISNGAAGGSVGYLLQNWQIEGLGLRYGPWVTVDQDDQVEVRHHFGLETNPDIAKDIVRKNISGSVAEGNLVVQVGETRKFSIPLTPDLSDLQEAVKGSFYKPRSWFSWFRGPKL